MPAKGVFHGAVKNALEKDGWSVTADPLHLKWGKRDFYVDLAASRFYLADKGELRIAIEVKGFTGDSGMFHTKRKVDNSWRRKGKCGKGR